MPRPGAAGPGAAGALDALATVRRHPEWFFRDGQFNSDEVLVMLANEAIRGGATAVGFNSGGPWLVVAADQDWLDGDVAAFFRPLSYAEGGQNSTRVEVALTAFCPAVVTVTAKGVYVVRSSPDSA